MELVDQMLAGDVRALSRLITLIERDSPETPKILEQVYPRTGKAYVVGVTGPPGSGKSTLVDRLTSIVRGKDLKVGILAVDPSSPFTGGAVLGDRIRMQQHYLDTEVFIRSMATRGSQGGLSRAAKRVVKLLDAFGEDLIFVETAGVGQTELEVMEVADTVIVVLVPEAGDAIQALKAGLTEIADIFGVNKADRPGADQFIRDLSSVMELAKPRNQWKPPILSTQAHNNIGIAEVYQALEDHKKRLAESSGLESRRRERRRKEFLKGITDIVTRHLEIVLEKETEMSALLKKVEAGSVDPYWAALEVIKNSKPLRDLAQKEEF